MILYLFYDIRCYDYFLHTCSKADSKYFYAVGMIKIKQMYIDNHYIQLNHNYSLEYIKKHL